MRQAGDTQIMSTFVLLDPQALEWAGSLTGLVGAALLALNTRVSRYGWVLFLASNIFFIAFALASDLNGLLLMQCGFTVTSLIGIARSWKPADSDLNLAARHRRYFRVRSNG